MGITNTLFFFGYASKPVGCIRIRWWKGSTQCLSSFSQFFVWPQACFCCLSASLTGIKTFWSSSILRNDVLLDYYLVSVKINHKRIWQRQGIIQLENHGSVENLLGYRHQCNHFFSRNHDTWYLERYTMPSCSSCSKEQQCSAHDLQQHFLLEQHWIHLGTHIYYNDPQQSQMFACSRLIQRGFFQFWMLLIIALAHKK